MSIETINKQQTQPLWDFNSSTRKENEEITSIPTTKVQVYLQRWLILILYCIYAIFSTIQWIEYAVIADIVVKYYSVSYVAVDWSSMVFSVLCIVFIIPGTYLIDKLGLRIPIIIGAIGTCAGTWIKVIGVHPDRYWIILLGQCVVGISQVLVLPVPAKLAAVWFGPKEVPLACTMGVVSMQVGYAVGFLMPPLLVKQGDIQTIEKGLNIMSYGIAVLSSILIVVLYFFFADAPPNPPSFAQLQIVQNNQKSFNYIKSLKNIFKNKSFIFLLIIYGAHLATPISISVLLNQLILAHYPTAAIDVGFIGLLMTATGVIGASIYGVFISKYGQVKLVTWVIYILSTLAAFLFVFLIDKGLTVVYILSMVASTFWNCIFCIGFELGVELTYPEPEAASGGLLTCSYQLCAIGMTYALSYIYKNFSELAGNLCLLAFLLLADSLLFFIKFDLKRSAVDKAKKDSNFVV